MDKIYSTVKAIMPDHNKDWNDILCSGPVDKVTKRFNDNFPRYEVNVRLTLANNAREYAEIYRDFFDKVPSIFTHGNCTHYSFLKKKGNDTYLMLERCGKFTLSVVAFFRDNSNLNRPDYKYFLQIIPKGERPIHATATYKDLATLRGMKEFFLACAKTNYEGKGDSCTALCSMIAESKAPKVNQLTLTGYDLKSGWYVYKYFAIDPAGKLHHPDKLDLYKLNHRDFCTPPPHAADKAIKPASKGKAVKDIHQLITTAWRDNGAAATAWVIGGWFVNQVKKQIEGEFFPHLSLYGDPGASKSCLSILLNAIQGINNEGIAMNSLNTKKGVGRLLSRSSGLFTNLREYNKQDDRNFDSNLFLTAYNRGTGATRAAFSNDNRVHEDLIQGTIMTSQNTEPFTLKAEKERVISLEFKLKDLNDTTRESYELITRIPQSELARVLVLTLEQRKQFEEGWQEAYRQATDDLLPMENRRILQNHALILGFHRIFCRVFKIDYDLTEFMQETAITKCRTSAIREYDHADHFFESLDLLNESQTSKCIFKNQDTKERYINLPKAKQLLREKGVNLPSDNYLFPDLKSHPAFVTNGKRIRFPVNPETKNSDRSQRRFWVFDMDKFD